MQESALSIPALPENTGAAIPFLTYFFSDLTGKIYKEEEFSDCYIIAFEKNPKAPEENTRILNKISPHLLQPAQPFQLTI